MDKEFLETLADVSEDLAIEILSEFTEEDYRHLRKSCERLGRAADLLQRETFDVPFTVLEVLRLFRKAAN